MPVGLLLLVVLVALVLYLDRGVSDEDSVKDIDPSRNHRT
jgi:hypothetical protein